MNPTNSILKRPHSDDEKKRSPARRKFRNENEKRRRDQFSQLVGELEEMLEIDKPITITPSTENKTSPTTSTNKLDKASVLRETAVCLRKHHHNLKLRTNPSSSTSANNRTHEVVDFSWKPPSNLVSNEEWQQTAIESMRSFFLVTKSDPYNGQIVYVSSNISSLLGYTQDELLNRSLFELLLPRDHDQLQDYFLKDHRVLEKCECSWRRATADEYEQCVLIGAFRPVTEKRDDQMISTNYLMAIVRVKTVDRTAMIIPNQMTKEFTSRLDLSGRLIHLDPRTQELLGYDSSELLGRTFFDFVHPDDLSTLAKAHRTWKQIGNGTSEIYRFLSKGQQWIPLVSQCQVQLNVWTGKPETYLCTTKIIQTSMDSPKKQVPPIPPSSESTSTAAAISPAYPSPTTTTATARVTPPRKSSPSDLQISSFVSHLNSDTYRENIRIKLDQRRKRKEAEIHVRQDEIKVIDDILQFIRECETKQSTTTTTTISLVNEDGQMLNLIAQESPTTVLSPDPASLPLLLPILADDSSPRPSPMAARRLMLMENSNTHPEDGTTGGECTAPDIFSPLPVTFNLPSPVTPFSIHSRPSPLSPMIVVPTPPSPLVSSNSSSTHESTSTASSSSTVRTGTSPSEPNKKPSFNRSLPRSLVS